MPEQISANDRARDTARNGASTRRLSLPGLIGLLLTLAYPFAVYWGIARFDGQVLALIILAIMALRLVLLGRIQGRDLRQALPLAIGVGLLCLLVLFSSDPRFFLYYPVLVNLLLLIGFSSTLRKPPTVIERFARLVESDLPIEAVAYCRKVTLIWCGFFVLNGGISLFTVIHGDTRIWMLYNGFVSYLLMGLLFGGEFIVRLAFRRRITAKNQEAGPCA